MAQARTRVSWRTFCSAIALCLLSLLMIWWFMQTPSNDRNWQPDVALQAYADIQGDSFTMYNIRDFEYQSESEYTVRHYNQSFRLSELVSVDLISSYWMGPHVAHHFLSFGFSNGEHLAISIETRKEMGEQYSTFAGFFRQGASKNRPRQQVKSHRHPSPGACRC